MMGDFESRGRCIVFQIGKISIPICSYPFLSMLVEKTELYQGLIGGLIVFLECQIRDID